MCVSIYSSKCNMQHLNNGFDKFKVNYSTHVKILIVQKMWKSSFNHSTIIAKHWVACVLIYYNKCKMQFVNNDFNILQKWFNSCTHVGDWKNVKKIINSFQYKCEVLNCYMCFNKLW
jgi:hypothetical protein